MASDEESDGPDPLGPARPILFTALSLGDRAAGAGDRAGAYALFACAARLARKVRGLSEVADFRLERALEEAENADEPEARAEELRAGLEALVGEDADPDPLPDAPLAAAQALIGRAISIGAPAYNTGDHQGCYDVYACTARAILATLRELPEAAAGRLREGLNRSAQMDDPDAQAWAMRHAFDAVGDMGGTGEGVPPQQLRVLVTMALALGAPALNAGDHRGCYEVCACAARLLVNTSAAPEPMKDVLRRALTEACVVPNVSRQARIMHEALESLLGRADE
ncbi:MAG: hypothetical protein J0I06_14935 [Planctomycetes bacterium]|nr:hypothetical protein [Planctomycetota bacterium]